MMVVEKVKKAVWNLGAILFFIWFGFKAIGYGMDILGVKVPSLCTYSEVAEFASPDGKKIAKLGYSDCGATTNWQTGVNIVDVESGNEYRGFFGLDGKPENLKVIWTSDIELTFSDFPLDKLLWFNQDYMSGVKVKIDVSITDNQLHSTPKSGAAD